MWAVSAVVVDLPLVPVMAITGAGGHRAARSRKKISISPMISTPACLADPTVQCGSGCVRGTPGAKTRDENFVQSADVKSTTGTPAFSAAARPAAWSSQAATSAPPASSARTDAMPEAPSPNTATR